MTKSFNCNICSSSFTVKSSVAKHIISNSTNTGKIALSPGDPNSYSRPDQVKTTHLHLELEIDFEQKVLTGYAVLTLEKIDTQARTVVLDGRQLVIHDVTEDATGCYKT